ncbi:MAG: tRNA 2-thiouridine(34) synthase MnmA [Gemmiger sp.]|nr:tRNA 2-thiouridine(34) synthase MnmA [Gemmiger sp.]
MTATNSKAEFRGASSPTPATGQKGRVLVGMSGGVDSSVCVGLLRGQGYEVLGAVIRFSPAHDKAVAEAKTAAAQLGVPLTVIDAGADFERYVVGPFCQSYCAGRTPNPCILCNPHVKFRALVQKANELGCSHIATGHYARVKQCSDGVYRVTLPQSAARDQTYMLYGLGQDVLSRLLLPLGEYEKDRIRGIARREGLSCADSPDSMEICFIPSGDYSAFIADRGMHALTGRFIGPDGADLGPHKGVEHYTIGQRKGLGLALGQPAFVREITPAGDVKLGWAGEEFFSRVVLTGLATPDGLPLPQGEYLVKIRSAAKPAPAHWDGQGDGGVLTFDPAVRAPAPGQSAVFYRDGFVYGGGIIESIEV